MSTSVNSSLATGELLGTGYQLGRDERDFLEKQKRTKREQDLHF